MKPLGKGIIVAGMWGAICFLIHDLFYSETPINLAIIVSGFLLLVAFITTIRSLEK